MNEKYMTKCACCGELVEKYDICETCGWQDDAVQNNNPNFAGGANKISLKEAKKNYLNSKNDKIIKYQTV